MKRQRKDRKKLVLDHGTIRELRRGDIEHAQGGAAIPPSDGVGDVFWGGGGGSDINC